METRKVDFTNRSAPWSHLGTDISDCLSVEDALTKSGLNWNVRQASVQSIEPFPVLADGFKINIRNSDDMPLGIVKDRYRVIQNRDAFAFSDALVNEGVSFQQAGQFQNGRKVWVLAKLPERYIIAGDAVAPYILFINSHDGTTGVKVAMTPIRVICCNMLNLAIRRAARSWSSIHAGDIGLKLQNARETLLYANNYMGHLGKVIEELNHHKLTSADIVNLADNLLPVDESMSDMQKKNVKSQKDDLLNRYYDAPDLVELPDNAYRFINAVSDFATHAEPLRRRNNYQEALFARVIDGHAMIDKAYQMLSHAA